MFFLILFSCLFKRWLDWLGRQDDTGICKFLGSLIDYFIHFTGYFVIKEKCCIIIQKSRKISHKMKITMNYLLLKRLSNQIQSC